MASGEATVGGVDRLAEWTIVAASVIGALPALAGGAMSCVSVVWGE